MIRGQSIQLEVIDDAGKANLLGYLNVICRIRKRLALEEARKSVKDKRATNQAG